MYTTGADSLRSAISCSYKLGMKLKFIFIKSKQNYKIHTNTQEFGIMSRIKDDNRT